MVTKEMSIFSVSKEYTDNYGRESTAKVGLTIDYENKTFWIVPNNKMNQFGGKFEFTKNPNQSNMWIAVAELISEATNIGVQSLKYKDYEDTFYRSPNAATHKVIKTVKKLPKNGSKR